MRALALCVVVLVVASLAAAVEPARACSCIPPDPWSFLKQADGAFVGRLVSQRETDEGRAVLTFRVERAVKGKIGGTVEVTTANNGAACGIETSVGQRIGLFLAREGDSWVAHLCWQVEPADLLAVAALPAPNGKGPVVMFVGGRFGPARTVALDAKRRTLAYGLGAGSVQEFSVCPGGRRVVELVERGSGYIAAIRELPTLRLVRERRLPRRDLGVADLRCVDTHGEKLALFSSGPDAHGLLEQITTRGATTLWRGPAFYASFWRDVAYVQVLGAQIVRVDLRTGARTTLGTVRAEGLYELVPNPAGTKLAGASFLEGCRTAPCAHLVVIDLRRPISARTVPDPKECCGLTDWIRNDRFAYFSDKQILVYTPTLQLVGRVSGWTADGAVIGSTAYGVKLGGDLLRADLRSGKIRVIQQLPGKPQFIASAAR